jgi:hypothetical protein
MSVYALKVRVQIISLRFSFLRPFLLLNHIFTSSSLGLNQLSIPFARSLRMNSTNYSASVQIGSEMIYRLTGGIGLHIKVM